MEMAFEALNEAGKPVPWWTVLPENVKTLSRLMCPQHMDPECQVLPYQAAYISTSGGDSTLVRVEDLAPLWSRYAHVARAALELAAKPPAGFVDSLPSTLPPAGDELSEALPVGEKLWRMENGLDVPPQE